MGRGWATDEIRPVKHHGKMEPLHRRLTAAPSLRSPAFEHIVRFVVLRLRELLNFLLRLAITETQLRNTRHKQFRNRLNSTIPTDDVSSTKLKADALAQAPLWRERKQPRPHCQMPMSARRAVRSR